MTPEQPKRWRIYGPIVYPREQVLYLRSSRLFQAAVKRRGVERVPRAYFATVQARMAAMAEVWPAHAAEISSRIVPA